MTPSRITMIRSEMASASSRSCGHVHRGDVQPPLQHLQLDAHLGAQLGVEVRQRLVERAAPDGEKTKARASATRCCWPPESLEALRAPRSPSCTEVERLAHARRHLGLGRLRTRRP
jgi:hypothetical protein